MPLLTFRAATSAGSNTFAANNLPTTAPTTVAGDLEVMWATVAALAPATPAAFTTPAGWNLGGSSSVFGLVGGALNIREYLYWRIAPGTGSAATLQTSPSTNSAMGCVRLSYANPDASSPFVQVSFGALASSTSIVIPSLTTTTDRALTNIFISQGAAQSITPPGTMTERLDNATYGASSADEQRATAGATGTRTFTAPAAADSVWGYAEFRSASVHASTGALVGPGAVVSGSAARTRGHDSTGALTGPGSAIVGSAQHNTPHASSGGLVGPGSTLAGAAARTRQHPSSGDLVGPGSAIAGTAARTRAHASSGVLTGPGSVVDGAAARTRQHAGSGDLVGPGSVIVGSADHQAAAGTHDATGALVGPGSVVVGSAARKRTFASSGALVGPGAIVTGSAARVAGSVSHAATGSLVGPGSIINGAAARANPPVSHNATGALIGPGSIVVGEARNGAEEPQVGIFWPPFWWYKNEELEEELEKLSPEVKEVIIEAAEKAANNEPVEIRAELKKEKIRYRNQYKEIYLQIVEEMRQSEEDEEIAAIVAFL